jgi:hypothetical protein
MAGQIDANYASPGLRWGLLLEDHPGATYGFELSKGSDIPKVGIPAEYGGDRAVCVATIEFPSASQLASVVAYKSIPETGQPDEWNVLCTKTLGRALKKAGYPDNLIDLKALVLWRQRNAEVGAITAAGGIAPLALGSGEAVTKALDAAATTTPAGRAGGDDDDESSGVHPETLAALREAFADLSSDAQGRARVRAEEKGTDLLNPGDEEQARRIIEWLRKLGESSGDESVVDAEIVEDGLVIDPETGEVLSGDAAMAAELVAGLDAKDTKLFRGYCKTIGSSPKASEMTEEQIALVLEWFASAEDGA